jgi:hypothetical protein
MKKLLWIAVSILCCVSAEASIRTEIRFPNVGQQFFAKQTQPSELEDYVPLSQQSFPIFRSEGSPTPRIYAIERLIEQQQQLNTSVERQRRLLEKFRQSKLLKAMRNESE